MKSSLKISILATSILLFGCTHSPKVPTLAHQSAYQKARTVDNFQDYIAFLKGKAASEGVSQETLKTQNNILFVQKAIDLDRAQAGKIRQRVPNTVPRANPNGTTNYLNKVLNQAKVNLAETNYWQAKNAVDKASQKYGVQPEYLLALWGMESGFGRNQGRYDVLSVLATLAFEGRREALFSKEFIAALKMLDKAHIQRDKMLGSWAGAMGQTQFMPSTFLRYAADGSGDGVSDIWKNQYDALSSIANYLHSVGWNNQLPWGVEVVLTKPINISYDGIDKAKSRTLKDWQNQGIILKTASLQEQEKLSALSQADLWLVRPDKEAGRAFLVSNNYRTILDWNKSNYFAVSIGMFADRIKTQVGIQ